MPRSVNLQIILILAAIMTCTASAAFAQCASCGAEDWTASAIAFLEGKPINESGPGVSGPHLARLKNTEFNSNLLNENPTQSSNGKSNLASTSSLSIDLNNVYASPNPVSPGNPVMLNAEFENASLRLPSTNKANNLSAGTMMVYAIIKNLAGIDIGRVDLNPVSGVDYAGIWNANATEGFYNATIVASSLNGSKTFSNVLEIGVSKPA